MLYIEFGSTNDFFFFKKGHLLALLYIKLSK